MIVLCSNGLTSKAICEAIEPKFKALHTAALVVTADYEYKKENYHVSRCVTELQRFGLTVSLIDIDDVDCLNLLAYDVVEFIGGNPYYLLHSIKEHHLEPILEKLAQERILVGWSAAAFVFGPTLALSDRYTPQMNTVGIRDMSALRLTDVQVLPHYSKYLKRFERFEEICTEYESENNVYVVRLNDGDAVIIDDDHACSIIRASQGKLNECI